MTRIYPIIMCGGGGTRLWPLSRQHAPKQYLDLLGGKSLLEATGARLGAAIPDIELAPPIAICGKGQAAEVEAHLTRAGQTPLAIIEEPMKRNTAAVAAVATQFVSALADCDALLLLLPSDAYISDVPAFWSYVAKAVSAAQEGHLVTFGIDPVSPHTGYGYVRAGKTFGENLFLVEKFVEKPDLETAKSYLTQGGYYWNAGIFLFQAKAMQIAFEQYADTVWQGAGAALERAETDGCHCQLDEVTFATIPSIPVDTAIMEKASKVATIAPVRVGWSDVGNWAALADVRADEAASGANHIAIDTENSFVLSSGPTVTTVGVSDLIIIATGDAVLVVPRDRAEDVKQLVELLKETGHEGLL